MIMKSFGGKIYAVNRSRRKGHELRRLAQRRNHAEKVRRFERKYARAQSQHKETT